MAVEKLTYSVKELAKAMNIGINAAYTLVKQPGFPAIRIGKQFRIPIDGLNRWLAQQSAQSTWSNDERKTPL